MVVYLFMKLKSDHKKHQPIKLGHKKTDHFQICFTCELVETLTQGPPDYNRYALPT